MKLSAVWDMTPWFVWNMD